MLAKYMADDRGVTLSGQPPAGKRRERERSWPIGLWAILFIIWIIVAIARAAGGRRGGGGGWWIGPMLGGMGGGWRGGGFGGGSGGYSGGGGVGGFGGGRAGGGGAGRGGWGLRKRLGAIDRDLIRPGEPQPLCGTGHPRS